MYLKAILLLGIGLLGSIILIVDHPSWRTAALLSVAIWGFCRAYYFAFYVIEHYIDGGYRFAGLVDFARYVAARRKRITWPSARNACACSAAQSRVGRTSGLTAA